MTSLMLGATIFGYLIFLSLTVFALVALLGLLALLAVVPEHEVRREEGTSRGIEP